MIHLLGLVQDCVRYYSKSTNNRILEVVSHFGRVAFIYHLLEFTSKGQELGWDSITPSPFGPTI